jgi:Ca2+-binding RTX toxin-like protein
MTLYIRSPSSTHVYSTSYQLIANPSGVWAGVVKVSGQGDSGLGPSGSGIVIASNLVLTANHVVNGVDAHAAGVNQWSIGGGSTGSNELGHSSSILPLRDGSIDFQFNDLAVIKTDTNIAPPGYQIGLATIASISGGSSKKGRDILNHAITAGFPGYVYSDKATAEKDTSTDPNSPDALSGMMSLSLNGSNPIITNGQAVWSANLVGADGHSGGGLWATVDGISYVLGNLTYANATGPQQGGHGHGDGVGGMLLTPTDINAIVDFELGPKAQRPLQYWKSQPANLFVLEDHPTQSISTSALSDIVEGGDGAADIVGSLGDDSIDGGPSGTSDLRYSSRSGDDEFAVSNTADIDHIDLALDVGYHYGDMTSDVVDHGGGISHQTLTNLRTVVLSDGRDTVKIATSANPEVASNDPSFPIPPAGDKDRNIVIDGGGQPSGAGDVLDTSSFIPEKPYVLPRANGARQSFGGVVIDGSHLVGTNVDAKNFEILYGTDNGDVISGKTDFKDIYLGNGNNLVQNLSGGIIDGQTGPRANWVKLYLGSGNSTISGSLSAGSQVFISGANHQDSIDISPDTDINGVGANDKLYADSTLLTGGVRDLGSVSGENAQMPQGKDPWYYGEHGIRYAVNASGQLVIQRAEDQGDNLRAATGQAPIDRNTYIDNFVNGVTAGITLTQRFVWTGFLIHRPAWVGSVWQTWDLAVSELNALAAKKKDPLILDLAGTGSPLSATSSWGPRFDVNGDGFLVNSGWTDRTQGILVKLASDGSVTSGDQFVGSQTIDGYQDLAAYDVNGDGVVDDSDLADPAAAALAPLRIWVDSNADHQAQANELLTLDQAGVASISLSHTTNADPVDQNGNQILATGEFTRNDGTTGAVSDALLAVDTFDSTYAGDTTLTANASALPNLHGHGTLPDLSVALSVDERAQIANGSLQAGDTTKLETIVTNAIASLSTTPDLDLWQQQLAPVFKAWTAALPDPQSGEPRWWADLLAPNGDSLTGDPEFSNESLVTTATDGSVTSDDLEMHWANVSVETLDGTGAPVTVDRLERWYSFASGRAVTDISGNVIDHPTLAQALATPLQGNETWQNSQARPDYYTIVTTAADGTKTFVDDLEYRTTVLAAGSIDPMTGDHVLTDTTVGYWAFASGRSVTDAMGQVIARPTLDQALAVTLPAGETWDVISSDALTFFERYLGQELPLGETPDDPATASANRSAFLGTLDADMRDLAIRLAMQGPLKDTIFAGIGYDVTSDSFTALTDQGFAPMFDAAFASVVGTAATDPDGALATLSAWNDIFQPILADYTPGAAGQNVTPDYLFANIVAAYESSGLSLPIADVAATFGIDTATLYSGTGTVDGASAQNMFYVAGSDTTYNGHNAVDYYVVGAHFGGDVIDDTDDPFGEKQTELRFASLNRDDLNFVQDGADLLITRKDTGETLRIVNQFTYAAEANLFIHGNQNPKNGIDAFYFADGTSWNTMDLSFAVAQRNTHDTVIYGTTGHDVLFAGPGDTLIGGPGHETYVYTVGSGSVTIDTQNESAGVDKWDTLLFGPGITLDDLEFHRDGYSNDLVIGIKGTSDTITVKGQFDKTSTGILDDLWLDRMDLIEFSDGSSLDADQLMKKMVADQAASSQTIYGFASDDIIDPTGVNQYMSGGDGNDTYIYNLGYGHDIVDVQETNFLAGINTTVAFGDGIMQQNVKFARARDSDDLIVSMPDGGSLTVKQFFEGTDTVFGILYYHIIRNFTFADGTSLSAGTVMNLIEAQNEAQGDITLLGQPRFTTFDDPHGNVTIELDTFGNDVKFDRGYGHITVEQGNFGHTGNGAANTITFGAGITADDLEFLPVPAEAPQKGDGLFDVIVRIRGTNDQLTLVDALHGYSNASWLTGLVFDDGTTLSQFDIEQRLLATLSASDVNEITGYVDADTIDLGTADRLVDGMFGGNTYVYHQNSGYVVIDRSWGGADTVQFDDLASTDVTFFFDGNDLYAEALPTGRLIRIVNDGTDETVGTFTFADGVTLSLDDIKNGARNAPDLSAIFVRGTDGNDTLVAGSGDQILSGGLGTDTYVYSAAGGNDRIEGNGDNSSEAQRKLVFSDIASTDVTLSRLADSPDLIVRINSTGKEVVVAYQFDWFERYEFGTFQFADGVTWTAADVRAKLLAAEASSDQPGLFGYWTDDTIFAGSTDRILNGEGGSDTYVYTAAGGNDRIVSLGDGCAVKLPDLSVGDVTFSFGSNPADLVIRNTTTGKTLTIGGFFNTTDASLQFSDATYLPAQVSELIPHKVVGTSGDDILSAQPGGGLLQGEGGSDNYRYASADGDVTIDNRPAVSAGRLTLTDLNSADVTLTRVDGTNDLAILVLATGRAITITSEFDPFQSGALGSIEFADGTVWDSENILSRADQIVRGTNDPNTLSAGSGRVTLIGGSGDDTLTGGTGSDTLFGAGGSDTLIAGDGPDVFVVGPNSQTTVTGYLPSTDKIKIDSSVFSSLADLVANATDSTGAIVATAHDGSVLTISDTTLSALNASDFTFGSVVTPDGTLDLATGAPAGSDGEGDYAYHSMTAESNLVLDSTTTDLSFNDLASTQVLVSRQGDSADAILSIPGFGKTITLRDVLAQSNGSLAIHFDDGVTWSTADLRVKALQVGSPLFTEFGFATDDTLVASQDRLNLIGGDGSDTYRVSAGLGPVLISDGGTSGTNALAIDSSHSADMVVRHLADESDVTLVYGATNDTITLRDELTAPAAGRVDTVSFADGSSVELDAVTRALVADNDVVHIATPTPDILAGATGTITLADDNQAVVAGPGDYTVIAGDQSANGSHDTYVYGAADGNLRVVRHVYSGNSVEDTLLLRDLNADDVVLSRVGNDLLVIDAATGRGVTIDGEFGTANLDGIEHIKFADGSILNRADFTAQAWYRAGDGDVTVTAPDGGGTMLAGPGNDTLISGDINNQNTNTTFVYDKADGNLDVEAHIYGMWSFSNTLWLRDLNRSDVTILRNGPDLYVRVNATGRTITVTGEFNSASSDGIQQILFADGTTLSRADIQSDAWYGAGTGDVTVTAQNGGGTMVAGPGNDTLVAGDMGNNGTSTTFVYDKANGNLDIQAHLWSWLSFSNTLLLRDLNADEVTLSRSGSDLKVTINATGKVITVDAEFNSTNHDGIQQIQFADGTTLSRSDIQSQAWYRAGAGDVTVTAQDGGGTMQAGPGNDTLVDGDMGNDGSSTTFVYDEADGNLDIRAHLWSWLSFSNTLLLRDLNPDEVTLSRSGSDLKVIVNATGKVITVDAEFNSTNHDGIQQIQFADGTTLSRSDIQSQAWYRAGAGDVTVTAQNGGGTMAAGPGNDTLVDGDMGNDGSSTTFVYDEADGNLDIQAHLYSWLSFSNTLLLRDLNRDDVTLSRSGSDLKVTVNATGKVITVDSEFNSTNHDGIQKILFEDGSSIGRDSLNLTPYRMSFVTDPGNPVTPPPGSDTAPNAQGDNGDLNYVNGTATISFTAGADSNVAVDYDNYGSKSTVDVFKYSQDDGNVWIRDTSGANDVLEFLDLASTDVTFSSAYNRDNGSTQDTVITVTSTGKKITLDSYPITSLPIGPQIIIFNDGFAYTRDQILAMQNPTPEPAIFRFDNAFSYKNLTTAYGSPVEAEVYFDSGNDTIETSGGTDTFIYSASDGNATILDHKAQTDRLNLTDLTPDDVTFSHGRIVEVGTHEELLREPDGLYASLWNLQTERTMS